MPPPDQAALMNAIGGGGGGAPAGVPAQDPTQAAIALLEQGDIKGAIELLLRLLQSQPSGPDAQGPLEEAQEPPASPFGR